MAYHVTGFVSTDTLKIGGITVANQSFVEMLVVPPSNTKNSSSQSLFDILTAPGHTNPVKSLLAHVTSNGVWGLGFVSKSGATPIHMNMWKQGKIKNPIFTLYLNP